MGGGGSVGFDSGQVVTFSSALNEFGCHCRSWVPVVVIVLTEFGWQFAVGFCSCKLAKYFSRLIHSENF